LADAFCAARLLVEKIRVSITNSNRIQGLHI
jgi:hypothetical protein